MPKGQSARRAAAYAVARGRRIVMREQGVDDFLLAKRRAADRLVGASSAAYRDRGRARDPPAPVQSGIVTRPVSRQPRSALEAIRLLADFRRSWSAQCSWAPPHHKVNLHLFTEARASSIRLEERGVPVHDELLR